MQVQRAQSIVQPTSEFSETSTLKYNLHAPLSIRLLNENINELKYR
jgi:hypothetical protein